MYKILQICKSVYVLEDQAKYYSTLVVGKEKALLWDCGSGLDDLRTTVQSITDKPLIVICSHAHFDHIGGSVQFEEVFLNPIERLNLLEYTDEKISFWLSEMNIEHKKIEYHTHYWKTLKDLNFRFFDLGDLPCEIIDVPGHSIGEIAVYIAKLKLILSGDSLLPVMTLLFKHHKSIEFYRHTLEYVNTLDFDYYLTSHMDHKLPKSKIGQMIECLDQCKGKRFHKYKYPYPPFGEGYFYLHSLEQDAVGLIIDTVEDI